MRYAPIFIAVLAIGFGAGIVLSYPPIRAIHNETELALAYACGYVRGQSQWLEALGQPHETEISGCPALRGMALRHGFTPAENGDQEL